MRKTPQILLSEHCECMVSCGIGPSELAVFASFAVSHIE